MSELWLQGPAARDYPAGRRDVVVRQLRKLWRRRRGWRRWLELWGRIGWWRRSGEELLRARCAGWGLGARVAGAVCAPSPESRALLLPRRFATIIYRHPSGTHLMPHTPSLYRRLSAAAVAIACGSA